MGPKKKQPRNAYYMFMLEYREQMKQKGITYPGGLKEVAEVAASEWKSLSKEEKEVYERMAKAEKQREKNDLMHKYTTTGKSFHQIDLEAQEQREMERSMEAEIISTVAVLDKQGMQEHPFFFMHVNYYCRVENGQFIPCELALCRFTFSSGASDFYHTIIDPVEIPLGYAYDAKHKSDETHQIPLPPHDLESEKNFPKILDNILRFLQRDYPEKQLPPIYAHGADGTLEAVKDVLDTLCAAKDLQPGPKNNVFFRVYPLHKLFFELRNKARDMNSSHKAEKVFPVESVAIRELEKDAYNWYPGIACRTHEGIDAKQFCSLSIVRRWSFVLADHCCEDLGIKLEPGVHIAPISGLEKTHIGSSHTVVFGREEPKKEFEPIIPTFVDYSKQKDDDKQHEEENVSITRKGRLAPCFSDVVRQPKSYGIALQKNKCSPSFSREEFPPMGGSSDSATVRPSNGSNLPFGETPVWVAGRGRPVERGNIKVQRGRGLTALTRDLSLRDEDP